MPRLCVAKTKAALDSSEGNHAGEQLLRQDQLVLFGATQAINLAVVLDPNFVSTASQCFEANDLW